MMQASDQAVSEFINHLTPGKVIDLQLGSPLQVRIKPTVIGVDLGNYLLLKFPAKLYISDYKDVLVNGGNVIVRYIVEGEHGECVAFSTTIKHVVSVPERLIFLNYPSKIEKRQLRTTQREKTHIPTQISLNRKENKLTGTTINGYVVDISANGCLFSFKSNGSQTENGVKKCLIHISITMAGQDEPLLISGHVKNNRIDNDQVLVGIMFDETSLKKVALLLDDMAIETA